MALLCLVYAYQSIYNKNYKCNNKLHLNYEDFNLKTGSAKNTLKKLQKIPHLCVGIDINISHRHKYFIICIIATYCWNIKHLDLKNK